MSEDFMKEWKEMQKAVMELNFAFKTFTQTQALEQKLMRKDIDQNSKEISDIKNDRKFAQRTIMAEVIKYAIIALAVVVATSKLSA